MRPALHVAAVVAVLAAAGPAAGARPAPSLQLAKVQPVVLKGAHFGGREPVKIYAFGTRYAVRATARGTFTLTVPQGSLSRCGSGRIQAVGARGSLAVLKLPLPACMPAKLPGRTP